MKRRPRQELVTFIYNISIRYYEQKLLLAINQETLNSDKAEEGVVKLTTSVT